MSGGDIGNLPARIRALRYATRHNEVTFRPMWTAVLFLGFGMAIDPLRLGLAVVLLSRRKPMLNLLVFWLGGMVAGLALGLAVLIVMRDTALLVIKSLVSAVADVRTTIALDGGRLQLALGVLALGSVSYMLMRERARAQAPVLVGGGAFNGTPQPRAPGLFARMGAITQNLLERGRLWPAFLAGLGSATPPVECLMVLTIIMGSGASLSTQLSAFGLFTLIVLAVIEIPLIAYVAMPERTHVLMQHLQSGIQKYRHRIAQGALSVAGVLFVAQGMGSL